MTAVTKKQQINKILIRSNKCNQSDWLLLGYKYSVLNSFFYNSGELINTYAG